MDLAAADLSEALRGALVRRGLGDGEVQQLQRLTGGATKQTWAFDWACGGTLQPLILQLTMPPFTAPGGPPKLGAEQDAALMIAAREGGVPAPELRCVLEPEDDLGHGYVTRRVPGEVMGRTVVHSPALATARAALAAQCGRALARIHALPAARLTFLQRLSPTDELRLYRGLLGGLEQRHAALAYALKWVADHLPAQHEAGVVHADFRTGNLIVDDAGLACVLDWEIARIGDPMQDLGVLCMRTWRFGGAGQVGGFGTRDDLYAAYEAESGRRVDAERVRFWEVFSNLKWAISCVRRGTARRADGRPASVELCAIGRRLEEPLWDLLALTTAA